MKIYKKKDKYILKLSHKELVLLRSPNIDLENINSQLFDKDEFKSKDKLLKKYAKIFLKINKELNKVDIF